MQPVHTELIHPWLYRFDDLLGVQSYLILGSERAILFDTGNGVGDYKKAIESITNLPYDVLIGHGHIDHANGAYQFDFVYLNPADFDVFKKHTSVFYRGLLVKEAIGKNINIDDTLWVFQKQKTIKPLTDGMKFYLGNLTVEAISLPGHTKGSMGLYIHEMKTMLTSDSVNAHMWLFLTESTGVSVYKDTLCRVLTIDFDEFYHAHSTEVYHKPDVEKALRVAEHANIQNGQPYKAFGISNQLSYTEDGFTIVYNKRTILL